MHEPCKCVGPTCLAIPCLLFYFGSFDFWSLLSKRDFFFVLILFIWYFILLFFCLVGVVFTLQIPLVTVFSAISVVYFSFFWMVYDDVQIDYENSFGL